MTVMALDVGEKRIGIAVSDAGNIIAFPYSTLQRSKPEADAESLKEVISEHQVEKIIYGYPSDMKGGKTKTGESIDVYVGKLKEIIQLPFEKIDERLTSVEARKRMRETGSKPSLEKARIDAIAAALILETWLAKRDAETRRGGDTKT